MKLATIATIVGIGSTLAGGYAYDLSMRADAHDQIDATVVAGDVELDLQRVELELKLYRTIEERRALTADEADRKRYLEELRRVLLDKQQGA